MNRISDVFGARETRRLSEIFFLAAVLLAQLSWLGALAYVTFWLL